MLDYSSNLRHNLHRPDIFSRGCEGENTLDCAMPSSPNKLRLRFIGTTSIAWTRA